MSTWRSIRVKSIVSLARSIPSPSCTSHNSWVWLSASNPQNLELAKNWSPGNPCSPLLIRRKTMTEKIVVYVCHCGTNIAGTVDVKGVAEWAAEHLKHRGVVIGREYKFMCSSLGQELVEKDIKELGLTRVIVAACSPHLHEKPFRTACERAATITRVSPNS